MKFKVVYFVLLLSIIFAVSPFVTVGEEATKEKTVAQYQKNRQAFIAEKKQMDAQYQAEVKKLQKNVSTTEAEIAENVLKLAELTTKLDEKSQTRDAIENWIVGVGVALFPGLSLIVNAVPSEDGEIWFAILYFVFLPVMVVNTCLYLFFTYRKVFMKFKLPIIIGVAALLVVFLSPLVLLAQDDVSKRQQVMEQLELTERMLSLPDHERFIIILESKRSATTDLPEIASGDPLLKVYSQVTTDSPEYFMTLAALNTYVGKSGGAVDAIAKMIEQNNLGSQEEHNQIVVNSIKFLTQKNQTELASKAVESIAMRIDDVTILLDLAEFLRKNGMQVSEDKVLGYAINKADTVVELLQLSEFLIAKGENDKGAEALEEALSMARDVDEILGVTKVAIKEQKDNIIEQVTEKTSGLTNFEDRLKIIDLFLENGRKEEAIAVFSGMIGEVGRSTPDKIEKLIFLIDAALEREFLPQTVKATERLSIYLGKKKSQYLIESATGLDSAKKLPDTDQVTLPQFYGLLNEELGYLDKAEGQYIISILHSLNAIVKSSGYTLPDSLNDYHLLGNVWIEENNLDFVEKLDQVYAMLEEKMLKQRAAEIEEQLQLLRKQVEEKEGEEADLAGAIGLAQDDLTSASVEVASLFAHLIAALILILGFISICVVVAYNHSRPLKSQKTFGFVMKFFETAGWLRVFSILGVVSGLAMILFAQLNLILQSILESNLKISGTVKESTNE